MTNVDRQAEARMNKFGNRRVARSALLISGAVVLTLSLTGYVS